MTEEHATLRIDDATVVLCDSSRMSDFEAVVGRLVSAPLEASVTGRRLRQLLDAGSFAGALAELESAPRELRGRTDTLELYDTLCRQVSSPPGYRLLEQIRALDAEDGSYASFGEMLAHKGLIGLPEALDMLHRAYPTSPISSSEYFSWRESGEVERARVLRVPLAFIDLDLDAWSDFAGEYGVELTLASTKAVEVLLGPIAAAGLVVANMGGFTTAFSLRHSVLGLERSREDIEDFVDAFLRVMESCSIDLRGEATRPGDLTMSCGVAWYDSNIPDAEEIKETAARRAEIAREAGGNNVVSG